MYDRSKSTFKLAGGKVGGRERMQVHVCVHVRKVGMEGGRGERDEEGARQRERERRPC